MSIAVRNLIIALSFSGLSILLNADPTQITPQQEDENQWISHQVSKDEIISNPDIIAKYKVEIEKVKQYKKAYDTKLQLFTDKDSLQKIKKQATYMSKLADSYLKKPWVSKDLVNKAITDISLLAQKISGYLHHPTLVTTELSDLSVPANRNRVEQLVQLWDTAFKHLYKLSVADSEIHVPGKENPRLVLINPWNDKLVFDAQGRILVASWVPEYVVKYWPVGQTKVIQGFVPWVSSVPELKKFIQNYVSKNMEHKTGFSLYERISQVLGLPQLRDTIDLPRYFVEMWINPKDLVRPCLESTIVGNGCYLDLENHGTPQTLSNIQQYIPAFEDKAEWMRNKMMTVREWFNENKKTTYTGTNAFPWARLGYTYDIGSLDPLKAGLSEFLVKPGSTVLIHSVTETNDYPQLPLPASKFEYKGPRLNK